MTTSSKNQLVPHGVPPVYFTFRSLEKLGVAHATTTRHCPGTAVWGEPQPLVGPEAVAALAGTGLDLRRLTWARQVHGADVVRATASGGVARGARGRLAAGKFAAPPP